MMPAPEYPGAQENFQTGAALSDLVESKAA